MVLTVTLEKHWKEGKIAHAVVKITFDNSYLTGGEVLDLSQYMKNVHWIDGKVTEDNAGYVLGFDDTDFATASVKCELFQCAGAASAMAESSGDHSSTSARIYAIGDAY